MGSGSRVQGKTKQSKQNTGEDAKSSLIQEGKNLPASLFSYTSGN